MDFFRRIGCFLYTALYILPLSVLTSFSFFRFIGSFIDLFGGNTEWITPHKFFLFGMAILLAPAFINLPRGCAKSGYASLIDLITAPIRVIFSAIALLLSFFSIFYDFGYDPFEEPEYDEGFFDSIILHLLYCNFGSGMGFSFGGGEPNQSTGEKFALILYQIGTTIVIALPYALVHAFITYLPDDGLAVIIFGIIGVVILAALVRAGAVLKGIDHTAGYSKKTTETYSLSDIIRDGREAIPQKIKESVLWIPSIGMIVYMAGLLFMIVPAVQIFTLVCTIVWPRSASNVPITHKAVEDYPNFSAEKLKFFIFGVGDE